MRTFVQKPKATQQTSSAKTTVRGRTHFAQSHEVDSILHLQRTIGNQAVQRLLAVDTWDVKENSTATQIAPFGHDFSRIPIHPPAAGPIQTKLAINKPGDEFEQEADRVSEQVMRMPEPRLQRACACGGGCPKCQTGKPGHGHERLQMTHVGPGDLGPSAAPSSIHDVLRSPGQPLDAATRTFMEPRFGHDFRSVRIHTDTEAAQSARQLHASAYTVGDHIVFAEGQLAPSTPEGDRLLAHELAHVVQGGGQNAILRRQPDPKGSQAEEARLRVKIVDTLEATKKTAIDAMVSAIDRGDRAYLEGLGLTSKQVDHLLNKTPQFEMMFGTAAELAVEQAVRADPFLSQYVKRGPQGRVPRGVGKPDWRIETPSSSVAVDLMTPEQVGKKLEMWRRQWKRGKPKWYIEKGLNITYNRPPGIETPEPPRTTLPAEVPPAATQEIAQVARTSGFRTAGRFLAREAPGLILQAVLMALFPPSVNIHNAKAEELSRTKLDPAVQDAVAKQAPMIDKLLDDDLSKSIYANVTVRLDYLVDASSSGDLDLYLKDVTLLNMEITNEDVLLKGQHFNQTGSKLVTNQITYSLLLYEPEYVTRQREWDRAQQAYEECVRRYGTGYIPPAAGAEAAQRNPEEGPCIRPRMKPMEGP